MSTFLMIHGINDSRSGTTQVMGDELERRGHNVFHVDQTIIRAWDARNRKKQMKVVLECLEVAREIIDQYGQFSIIAHSNACLVSQYLVHNIEDACVRNMYFFNAALNHDWTWNQRRHSFMRAYVIYNPSDKAILAASLLRLNHPWGSMGRLGPATDDLRVHGKRDDLTSRHSGVFHGPNLKHWCNHIEHWERGACDHA